MPHSLHRHAHPVPRAKRSPLQGAGIDWDRYGRPPADRFADSEPLERFRSLRASRSRSHAVPKYAIHTKRRRISASPAAMTNHFGHTCAAIAARRLSTGHPRAFVAQIRCRSDPCSPLSTSQGVSLRTACHVACRRNAGPGTGMAGDFGALSAPGEDDESPQPGLCWSGAFWLVVAGSGFEPL